jgi:hypothetical protein
MAQKRGGRTMNKYKKIPTLVALALLCALTSPAWGMIGQTPDQVIRRAKRDKDTLRIEAVACADHSALQVYYRDGANIEHLFGQGGREIAWFLTAPKRLTNEEVFSIQRLYKTRWEGTGIYSGVSSYASQSNLYMGVSRTQSFDAVTIIDQARMDEVGRTLIKRQQAEASVPRTYPPQWEPFNPNGPVKPGTPDEGLKPSQVTPEIAPVAVSNPAPTSQPVPIVAPQIAPPSADIGNGPTDCYLRAAKIYGYLKGSCYWLEVAGVRITDKTTGVTFGHAVVFSQLTPSSKVVMSDYNGGLDLETKSHDLAQLSVAAAAATQNSNGPYTVQSVQGWITE